MASFFRRWPIGLVSLLLVANSFTQALGQQEVTPRAPDRHILFILDASGSMTAKLPGGGTRMEAAQFALIDMVQKLPATTQVALRVYGHTSPTSQKNCEDTELVMGFGAASAQKDVIRSKVMGLKALGYTPISISLEKAARDFDGTPKRPRTVILVSDGRETCKADPCAVAAALAKVDADLVVHTIGFGVDDVARRQLQCVSRVARGSYFDAKDRGELQSKLAEVASLPPPKSAEVARPAPPPVIKQEVARPAQPPAKAEPQPAVGTLYMPGHERNGGSVVTNSTSGTGDVIKGERLQLPPGIYTLKLRNGDWPGIEIKAGETTEIRPAFLKVTNPETVFQLLNPETQEMVFEVGFETGTEPLTPGRYAARTLDGFAWPEEIELKAGATTVLKAALLRIKDESIPSGWYLGVVINGNNHKTEHPFGHGAPGLPLPPGRYELKFSMAPQVPAMVVDLKEDAVHEIAPVVLGTMRIGDITAADNVAIHEASTEEFIVNWMREEMQLAVGQYYLVVNGQRRDRFEIRPGQTTEIMLRR